ncbi:hypothetical protein SAMN05216323_11324 [Williamwhitmania taraxaci]|uniref:Uncharacterized protein n=1 Tax=Williamwhitmania taraxaci TaxID=1640674 RepID=A0A1G6TRP2_9BACT|nr:hypothetical protein SAMN05216323_11324 [Williamwhitmania taraxaci]
MKRMIFTLKHWQVFILLCSPDVINVFLWQASFSIGTVTALQISVFSGVTTIILFFSWITLNPQVDC